jgi:hypothetical protein
MSKEQKAEHPTTERRGGYRSNSGRKPRTPEEKCTYQLNLMIQKSLHEKIDGLSKDCEKHKSTIAAILLQQYLSDEYIEKSRDMLKKFFENS